MQKPTAAPADDDARMPVHPSAPLPVQGPGVRHSMRVPLGESGYDVFPLAVGGAEFGWNIDIDTSREILDAYVAHGGNIVHTADNYSTGRSEHIIGQWAQARGIRDELVLTTRVGRHPDHPGLGPVNLVRSVEGSLTRLRTDQIDVLYLDGAGAASRLEDVLATVDWLIQTGKVRALGAYGFRAEQLVEARILASAGLPRFTVLDVAYNILRRDEFDGDLKLVAGAQSMAVTPSHPLEHGFLAGRYRSRTMPVRSVRGAQRAESLTKRGVRTLRALDAVAAEAGISLAAVSVAWLLSQRLVVAPIVNADAAPHIHELVQGTGVRLSRAQLSEIARASE